MVERCVSATLQAAKLLAMYRELKRRQAVGLAPFYTRKLAALEDALLAAREALFAAQEPGADAGGRGPDAGSAGGAEQQQSAAAAPARGQSPQRGPLQRGQQGARAGAALEVGGDRDQDGGDADEDQLEQVGLQVALVKRQGSCVLVQVCMHRRS